jgi:hypothetical protein
MFTAEQLRGFVNTLTVQTSALNADAAKALLVSTAGAARDRVLNGSPRPTGFRQVVDGIEGAALAAVRPDGVIVFAWQYLGEVVVDTYGALVNRAPRDSGEYIAGILVLADGAEAAPEEVTGDVREVVIVASAPYARRLEIGKRRDGSPFVVQVAAHIVQETAAVAKRLWGDLADFEFTYVSLSDGYRLRTARSHRRRRGVTVSEMEYPAIRVTPRQA